MGPILQYVVGVPFGLFCLVGGPFFAYLAFTNQNQPQNNGFWCLAHCGAILCEVGLSATMLYAR